MMRVTAQLTLLENFLTKEIIPGPFILILTVIWLFEIQTLIVQAKHNAVTSECRSILFLLQLFIFNKYIFIQVCFYNHPATLHYFLITRVISERGKLLCNYPVLNFSGISVQENVYSEQNNTQ